MSTIFIEEKTTGTIPEDFHKHLRPFPAAAAQLMQACKDPKCHAKDISKIIETDPGLTARMMKISNSSMFGCSGRIKTINQSVVLLGMKTIRDMAVSMAGAELFSQKGIGADIQKSLWAHSLATACIARTLTETSSEISASEAFLAGLFHDVGKIVFIDVVPEQYFSFYGNCESKTRINAGRGSSSEQLESERFGISHTEIGLKCGEHWGLPQETIEAITYHHHPEDAPTFSGLAKICNVSSQLARLWNFDTAIPTDAPAFVFPQLNNQEETAVEEQPNEEDFATWTMLFDKAKSDFEETAQVCNNAEDGTC